MNIKDLKEIIKDLPDDMPVENCCGVQDTGVEVRQSYSWSPEGGDEEYDFLWIGAA